MHNHPNKQFLYTNERVPNLPTASMFGDTFLYRSLRKELAMAGLIKRRETWYARIRWYIASKRVEKQIPLRTKSKVTARERLAVVNKVESDIKSGIGFTFPWLSGSSVTKVKRFTLEDVITKWMDGRKKGKLRPKTIETNQLGLDYLLFCLGCKRPLRDINNDDIERYIDHLRSRGNSDNSINIHLRTVKAMFRYFLKAGTLRSIPLIEQVSVSKIEPVYITDNEFQSIMELEWLGDLYKRVFLLYRETGMRLREPMISTLNGNWIDIPPESKTHSTRSIELSKPLKQIFSELQDWYHSGYGSRLNDPGDHFSKKFKKSLRSIGASESKHFHSLRHTFAVRRLLMNTSIYDVKLMMGHASVTTTEIYSKMNLKRVAQDFPTLVTSYVKTPEFGPGDTELGDTLQSMGSYMPLYQKIEG